MKIQNKIIGAFIIIIVVALVVMAFTSSIYIDNIFDRYTEDYRGVVMENWEQTLISYYVSNGSWEDVDGYLTRPRGEGRGHSPHGHGQARDEIMGIMPGERLILADEESRVVLDSQYEMTGEMLPQNIHEKAKPLIVEGEEVGRLVILPDTSHEMLTLEEEFSRYVLFAVFWGGLAALLVGAAISLLITRQITSPLKRLMTSARRFAQRDFEHRVEIKDGSEIGGLAEAFNLMADNIEKNEKLRNNLIADVSHELRTPLTVLRGNLEALQSGKIAASPELLSSLYDEILRLNRLVKDLESINLAESGKLPLNYGYVRLKELLERVVAAFYHEALERNIGLKVDVRDEKLECYMDEDRIMQVLINLLANAFKFTPDNGEIEIKAERVEGYAGISISDSGSGIPEKELPYIFERFYKAEKGRGEGSGLGLSIAKSFVEIHDGKIMAANNPDQGSVITLYLPFNNIRDKETYVGSEINEKFD